MLRALKNLLREYIIKSEKERKKSFAGNEAHHGRAANGKSRGEMMGSRR